MDNRSDMAASYKLFLIILTILLVNFCRLSEAADSAFIIDRVQVDVTADNAADAREKAFEQAQLAAFRMLAGRLLPERDLAGFEPPSVDVVSALVEDFEVLDEQLSHIRYIGTYKFRFRERAVSDFFSNKGVAHTEVSSKPVLVIPFYQWGSRNLLWSEENPWLSAWKESSSRRGLVPVVVPIGDLQDITDISEEKALSSDWSRIGSMRERYGAGEIIVLLAVPQWSREGQVASLRIDVYTLEGSSPSYASSFDFERRGGEPEGSMYERAAATIREKLQEIWKNMTVADPRQTNEVKVRVRFGSVDEWVATRAALDGIKMLDEMRVESLNPREAFVRIRFRGDESRLRLALSQKDLILSKPQVDFSRQASPMVYDLYLNRGNYTR